VAAAGAGAGAGAASSSSASAGAAAASADDDDEDVEIGVAEDDDEAPDASGAAPDAAAAPFKHKMHMVKSAFEVGVPEHKRKNIAKFEMVVVDGFMGPVVSSLFMLGASPNSLNLVAAITQLRLARQQLLEMVPGYKPTSEEVAAAAAEVFGTDVDDADSDSEDDDAGFSGAGAGAGGKQKSKRAASGKVSAAVAKAAAKMASEEGEANATARAVIQRAMNVAGVPEKARTEMETKYTPLIRAAAAKALQQLDKFVPVAIHKLRYRLRFDPCNEPDALVFEATGKAGDESLAIARFFGVAVHDHDPVKLKAQWKAYRRAWASMTVTQRTVGISRYWNSTATKMMYPDLSKVGSWYADMPASSVAAERVFAIMRSMEDDLRSRMKRSTVVYEVMARVNAWLTDIADAKLVSARKAYAALGAAATVE